MILSAWGWDQIHVALPIEGAYVVFLLFRSTDETKEMFSKESETYEQERLSKPLKTFVAKLHTIAEFSIQMIRTKPINVLFNGVITFGSPDY